MAIDDIRIVLVEPAHPGNVGAVARAMKTMSFRHLVLVRPNSFPSLEADRRATGAIDVLERAQVVEELGEAIGDCRWVVGCSARERTIPHTLLDARSCGTRLIEETSLGEPAALVFGPERMGLANQDLDRCTAQVLIPTDEAFSSLNLAAAVQLVCYETFIAARAGDGEVGEGPTEPLPSQREMEYFFEHLERALDTRDFLEGEMREITMSKLRRLFGRARPNTGELKMLRTLLRFIHRDGD